MTPPVDRSQDCGERKSSSPAAAAAAPAVHSPPAPTAGAGICSSALTPDGASLLAPGGALEKSSGLQSQPQPSAGLNLSDSALAFLAIVAAHDRTTPEEFLTRCICQRLDQIGLSVALDFVEAGRASHTPESEEGREGVPLGVLPVPRAPP